MLVLDGGDLVGKSTLVGRAVKRLQGNYGLMHMPMHLTRPPHSFDYLVGYVDKMSTHTVWDRFHPSNLAYRANDDHPSSMNPVKFDLVEAHFRLVGGYCVIVTADDELIRARHAERGDSMYSLEHILRVNETFHRIANSSSFDMRGERYRYHIDARLHVTVDQDYERLGEQLDCIVDAYVRRLVEMGLVDDPDRVD